MTKLNIEMTSLKLMKLMGVVGFFWMLNSGVANGQQTSDSLKTKLKSPGTLVINNMYSADPAVHVFNGKLYIYPSHDIETTRTNANGDHFDMKDYHVFSLDSVGGQTKDHGVVLDLSQVKWAERQMWAPDVAYKNGKYYLYFPARDKEGVFRIGVTVSSKPEGPFVPNNSYMANTFSIDPGILQDTDGKDYLYFGGLWGGQLQKWVTGVYNATDDRKEILANDQPALGPRVAKLDPSMTGLAEKTREVQLLDELGKPILAGDHHRRFFEGAWVFKIKETYYFTYSTGDTHNICYATGTSPYGPFTYKGIILKPVAGWTTHHSIVNFKNKWYLFYHDTLRSGKSNLRDVRVMPLHISDDGVISTLDPLAK